MMQQLGSSSGSSRSLRAVRQRGGPSGVTSYGWPRLRCYRRTGTGARWPASELFLG